MRFNVGDTVRFRLDKGEYFITEIFRDRIYLNNISYEGDAEAWPVHQYSLTRRRNLLIEKCKSENVD